MGARRLDIRKHIHRIALRLEVEKGGTSKSYNRGFSFHPNLSVVDRRSAGNLGMRQLQWRANVCGKWSRKLR